MAAMCKPSIDEVLTCGKCSIVLRSNDVTTPRYLNCLHAFCGRCLPDIFKVDPPNTTPICPLCQTSSPQTKIDNLPTVFFLRSQEKCESILNEIREGLLKGNLECQRCTEAHAAAYWCTDMNEPLLVCAECASLEKKLHPDFEKSYRSLTEDPEIPALLKLSERIYCPIHNELSDLFCLDCQTSMCKSCDHHDHLVQNLHELARLFRERIRSKIQDATDIVNTLTRRLMFIERDETFLKTSSKVAAQEMASFFNELRRCIAVQEKNLQEQLVSIVSRKTVTMKDDTKETQRKLIDFKNLSAFLSATHKYGTDRDVMIAREGINGNLSKILPMAVHDEPETNGLVTFKPGMLVPLRLAQYFGQRFQDVISQIPTMVKQVGSIRESPVSPGQSTFEISQKVSGIEIKIGAFMEDGQRYGRGGDPFVIEIRDPGGGVTRPHLFDNDSGKYTTTYVPQTAGKYHVAVHLFGRPIKGSPYIFEMEDRRFKSSKMSQEAVPVQDSGSYEDSSTYVQGRISLLADPDDTPPPVPCSPRPGSVGYVRMRPSVCQSAHERDEDICAYLETRRRSSRRGSYVLHKIDEFGLHVDEEGVYAERKLEALHEMYEPAADGKPQKKRWFRKLKH